MAKVVGFNYEIVENKGAATKARESAKQIRKLLEQSAVSVVTIGKLMAEVKETLTPAVFTAWVECEFGWVPSVASNYMQAARVFGDLDCLKQFQPSAICMLARKSIPEGVVKDAIRKARAGELITYSAVGQLLKAAGHQSTQASAGKARKPLLRPIPAERATFTQVRDSVESLASILGRITMQPAELDSLSAKLFELSMLLRQAVPAAVEAAPQVDPSSLSKAAGAAPATKGQGSKSSSAPGLAVNHTGKGTAPSAAKSTPSTGATKPAEMAKVNPLPAGSKRSRKQALATV